VLAAGLLVGIAAVLAAIGIAVGGTVFVVLAVLSLLLVLVALALAWSDLADAIKEHSLVSELQGRYKDRRYGRHTIVLSRPGEPGRWYCPYDETVNPAGQEVCQGCGATFDPKTHRVKKGSR
jgi:hypothetical protein